MKKIYYILISIVALSFVACTEDINLTIVGSERKLVVEGRIENGNVAEVLITRNIPISKSNDLSDVLVTDAKVYVSDGVITDTLALFIDTLSNDTTSSLPFVYFEDKTFRVYYKGSKIVGAVGNTYFLTIEHEGKTYTSSTLIPTPVAMDSIWWKPEPPSDTAGFAWAHLTEPAGIGNAYIWYAKRPTKDLRYLYASVFDDKFIDGKSFDTYFIKPDDPILPKPDTEEFRATRFMYKYSDTVYVKFCSIDYQVFRFYLTLETAVQSNGNPFASPVAVPTNIEGDNVIGVWGGFGVTRDTIMPTVLP